MSFHGGSPCNARSLAQSLGRIALLSALPGPRHQDSTRPLMKPGVSTSLRRLFAPSAILKGDFECNRDISPTVRTPHGIAASLRRHCRASREARLDDYASSLAILPECSLVRIVEEERDCPIRIGGLNVWDHASSRLHEPRLELPHPQLSIAAP